MIDLRNFMTDEGIAGMHGSWLAWSPGTLLFTPLTELVLGFRKLAPNAIPEDGDLCLTAGFNTYVPGPAMWAAAADAWLLGNLGMRPDPERCSDFLPVEYDMAKITVPLKTSVGTLNIKRAAFHRLAGITEEQADSIRPQNRLKDVLMVNRDQFEAYVRQGTRISFPHEVDFVRRAFDIVERVGVANIGQLRATWALPPSRQPITRPGAEHS